MAKRLAIIGAGPIGLEAALAARSLGWEVKVYERGQPGAAVRRWGHVRMFSPFGINVSPEGAALVRAAAGSLPDETVLLTGREFVEAYLEPLARELGDLVITNTGVLGLSRPRTLKGDLIGDPLRAQLPFELLVEKGGRERIEEADVVFDCSGTFGNSNALGDGGAPAAGERQAGDSILYGVPDVLGSERSRVSGRVMVVGAGHSAATVVRDLAALRREESGPPILWIVRRPDPPPCRVIASDPLSERAKLTSEVNTLAGENAQVDYRPGRSIRAIDHAGEHLLVSLRGPFADESVEVDLIIAATGFRPDLELARELQVNLCYATEGTLPLAALLLGEAGGDCLATGGFGAEVLKHPEPNYFALGMKSFGRNPDFLIRTGREQIASVLEYLTKQ